MEREGEWGVWLWITREDDTVDDSLAASSTVSLDMLAGYYALRV